MIEPIDSYSHPQKEISITGVGITTCLGLNLDDTWAKICQAQTDFGAMSAMESKLPEGSTGGQAPDLPKDFYPDLPREPRYLRWAIIAALKDSGLFNSDVYDSYRCATALGTTLHGMRAGGRYLRNKDANEFKSFLAGDVASLAVNGLRLKGEISTTCSACSSSLSAIAMGAQILQSGSADMVVAGGYDTISEYAWGGFNSLRLVSGGLPKPFSKNRDGLKLGEGYGVVILERSEDSKQRGARSKAVIAGWAESSDAYHLTRPDPQGQGVSSAINKAFNSAKIAPEKIDLIAAHATATPDNDKAEFAGLNKVFGANLPKHPVVAFKSYLGHTLGGAGAVELILSTNALIEQTLPGSANVNKEEIEFENLNLTVGKAKKRKIDYTLNMSMGFGGANTALVLKKADKPTHPKLSKSKKNTANNNVCITGIGVLLPGITGKKQFINYLQNGNKGKLSNLNNKLKQEQYDHLLDIKRTRRMSPYVKQTLAVAALSFLDSNWIDKPVGFDKNKLASGSAILATTHGSIEYCLDYYSKIVSKGARAANPMLFAEGVPNAAAAQLSLLFGLKNESKTIIGTRTAGLDALRFAANNIRNGSRGPVLVAAAQEAHSELDKIYKTLGLQSKEPDVAQIKKGFTPMPAAVAFVLESENSANQRGTKVYGKLDKMASFCDAPDKLARTLNKLFKTLPKSEKIITCKNGTWLDRATKNFLKPMDKSLTAKSLLDCCVESFSCTPLLEIAGNLLDSKTNDKAANSSFTTICSDWNGVVSSATLQR